MHLSRSLNLSREAYITRIRPLFRMMTPHNQKRRQVKDFDFIAGNTSRSDFYKFSQLQFLRRHTVVGRYRDLLPEKEDVFRATRHISKRILNALLKRDLSGLADKMHRPETLPIIARLANLDSIPPEKLRPLRIDDNDFFDHCQENTFDPWGPQDGFFGRIWRFLIKRTQSDDLYSYVIDAKLCHVDLLGQPCKPYICFDFLQSAVYDSRTLLRLANKYRVHSPSRKTLLREYGYDSPKVVIVRLWIAYEAKSNDYRVDGFKEEAQLCNFTVVHLSHG